MGFSAEYDGFDLTAYFDVTYEIVRGLPNWEPALIDVPAMDGAIFAGTRVLPYELELTLLTKDEMDKYTRTNVIRHLSALRAVSEPKKLIFSDENGLYRMAVPTGDVEVTHHLNADEARVRFICPDPRMYGTEYTVSVGTTARSVTVLGSAPTKGVVVTVTATPSSEGVWRITDSTTGEYMELTGLATGTTHAITIDCDTRTVTVDGDSQRHISEASDWLTLAPGRHSLRVTVGSGTASVKYREMWW